jgi:hypothetical protein
MALTKVTTSGLADDSVTSAKVTDGVISAADVADGTLTVAKLTSTLDLSSNTVTLPNTSVTNDMLAGSIANAKLANSSFTLNGTSINLGDTTEISAGTSWQTGIVADGSTVTTAVAGNGYFIDTTSAAHTINLPASPSLGDEVSIVDASGTADTNNITVGRNSENIQGTAADLTISTERAGFTLVYFNSTQGWLLKDK